MATQWIEVDADRLARNVAAFRQHVDPSVHVAAVVKSNGYGHGLEFAAQAFVRGGASWLCVHSLVEAQRVRTAGLAHPVLILGPLAEDEVGVAVEAGFDVTTYDPQRLLALDQAGRARGRRARVHLKIETGTNRQGADSSSLRECIDVLRQAKGLELIGASSHFANIEDTTDHSYAQQQLGRFQQAVARLGEVGLTPSIRHMAASAAAILFPSTHFEMVRVGIAGYGYWPSRETLVSARQLHAQELDLAPALTWKVQVAQVKHVPAGSFIGYGCTEKVEVDTTIAVLPVGYADGYRRSFTGKARVLLHGRRCPVRGRICMNLIMVDVTHLSGVEVGDEAVLLGTQGSEALAAETLAGWADTIHYEVLAGLSAQIPRVRSGAQPPRARPEAPPRELAPETRSTAPA